MGWERGGGGEEDEERDDRRYRDELELYIIIMDHNNIERRHTWGCTLWYWSDWVSEAEDEEN